VSLRGVVCAVPGEPLPVDAFASTLGPEELAKAKSAVGLGQVHRVRDGQTAGDLCIDAAQALLRYLGWEPESVDGVIMVTQTPDHIVPATACIIHGKLGLAPDAFAYDVNLGCSGYLYGLWLASQAVASGAARRVLLLAGDTSSQTLCSEDRSVVMLFGEAGTATALEFESTAPVMSFVLGSDGKGARSLMVPAGGFRIRPNQQAFLREKGDDGNIRAPMNLYMDGISIFNFSLQRVPPLIQQTLALHGWSADDVDAFLFHQANGMILKALAKRMKLPAERVPMNIGKYGNTSMASIPLLLADEFSERLLGGKPQALLLVGFGAGYSWAAAAAELSRFTVAKVIRTE
jgi:3-oxoacyl-[acyl-carrier-protein] synthase-3